MEEFSLTAQEETKIVPACKLIILCHFSCSIFLQIRSLEKYDRTEIKVITDATQLIGSNRMLHGLACFH